MIPNNKIRIIFNCAIEEFWLKELIQDECVALAKNESYEISDTLTSCLKFTRTVNKETGIVSVAVDFLD